MGWLSLTPIQYTLLQRIVIISSVKPKFVQVVLKFLIALIVFIQFYIEIKGGICEISGRDWFESPSRRLGQFWKDQSAWKARALPKCSTSPFINPSRLDIILKLIHHFKQGIIMRSRVKFNFNNLLKPVSFWKFNFISN